MSYKNVLFSMLAFLLAFQWAGAYAATEQVTYVHTDHLGSPILGRDAQGDTVFEYDYSPYGARKTYLGSPGTLGYTGHAQHDDMGLVYAGARWMEPEAGRFLSPDPVRFGEGGAKYFNRYAYVDNNPFRFYDPSGAYIESAWDVANLAIGLASLSSNVSDGNWGGAALDGAGLLVDGVATVVPILPAGAGTAIKAGRVTKKAPDITTPYKRPSGATTKAQRESVQNKPCVDCGATTSKQVADHKTPLVKEYYQTGTIDKTKMRSVDSVQPQCPTCSARQGAEMSRYSRQQKKDLGL